MFIRGETLLAHSAHPRKIPGWIVVVRENFPVYKRAYGRYKIELYQCVLVYFLFQILHLTLTAFILKSPKKFNMIFKLERRIKFSGEH